MSESAEQMHKRLCSVIAAARFEVLFQPYASGFVAWLAAMLKVQNQNFSEDLGIEPAGKRPSSLHHSAVLTVSERSGHLPDAVQTKDSA